MKKIISLILLFMMLMSTVVFADTNSNLPDGFEIIDGKLFENGIEITEIYTFENGIKRDISIYEYISLITREHKVTVDSDSEIQAYTTINEVTPLGMAEDWYRYDESSNSSKLDYGQSRRISVPHFNDGPIGSGDDYVSVTASTTQQAEFDANLLSFEYNYVSSGASFNFLMSKSYSEEHTISVPPQYYGWIEFTPRLNVTKGYMKTFSWLGDLKSQKYSVSESPATIGGQLDGLYVGKKSTSMPK